ncbi:hypothetical protein TNCV_4371011 [Trichonephila clavipes]|nr:hypothetical protein TNCV_4371011 [Trichonephila clavipes]
MEVEIGGVAIYRPFEEFHRANSYGLLHGSQVVHIVSGLLCMSKVSLKAECAVWVPPNKVNTMPKGEIANSISYRNRFLKANLIATVNENPYAGIKRKA